jgi:uncharacterized membrane protein YsdA (DUF1294 family)/cold shock CspA family protein
VTSKAPNGGETAKAAPRSRGRLVNWNDDRGFGFISPSEGGPDVFVHASAFVKEGRHIEIGHEYEFDIETGKDGRPKAKRIVTVVAEKRRPSLLSTILDRGPRFLVIPAFLFIVVAIATVKPVPASWLIVYGVASVACFVGYGLDKRAAHRKEWRVSETILLMVGLVGGWPGAIIGQEVFRHKTQKVAFRTLFWMSVAINMAAFIQITAFSSR